MLYSAIKLLYPDIKDSEFSLQDDGEGAYISSWKSETYPLPSLEDLQAFYQEVEDLQNIKSTILPFLDSLFNSLYRTNGKNYDGVLLQRFYETFNQSGEISYRNEFHNKSDFNTSQAVNFKHCDLDMPLSNDKGFLFVENKEEPAEAILNTGVSATKIVLGSLSTIIESGYNPLTDVEISFIKGSVEVPIVPFFKKPYSVFGYANLPAGSEKVKIKLKLNPPANGAKPVAIVDVRIATD